MTPLIKHLFILYFTIGSYSLMASSSDSLEAIWSNKNLNDSTRFNAVNKFYLNNTFVDPNKTLKITQNHLFVAQSANNANEIFKAVNERAIAFMVLGNIDSTLLTLNRALVIANKNDDTLKQALISTNLANVYRELNQYQEAIKHYSKSLIYFENRKTELNYEADILNNIGLIYQDIGMYTLSLQYLKKALKKYQLLNKNQIAANIWLNLGGVYEDLDSLSKAKKMLFKALKELDEKDISAFADCHMSLGMLYEKLNKADSANYYYEKGISISKELGNPSKILANTTIYTKFIFTINPNKACEIAQLLKSRLKGNTDQLIKKDVFQLLYQCYKGQGNPKLALEMLENYQMVNDSLSLAKDQLSIVRKAIKSEFEQKLFQSQLNNEKNKAQLEIKQLNQTYKMVLTFLILIILVFLFYRRRLSYEKEAKQKLLNQIEILKNKPVENATLPAQAFSLNRTKLENRIGKKLNETDWKVLNILTNDPVISNKDLSKQAFLTVDGIGSSLRRMYATFEIKESKYKKISLLMEAIKISNQQ